MKGLPLILTVITSVVIVALVGMPLGGFVFGIANAQGPGNPIPVRLVYAALTPITLGFPPRDECGNHYTYNAWPYILGTDLALVIIVAAAVWIISIRRSRNKS